MRGLKILLLFLVLGIGIVSAQVSSVRGVVYSADNNEPIIGATVMVKGTTVGTVTDIDGKYIISNLPANAKTLVISYVGMVAQDVVIRAGEIKTILNPDVEQLDEVVVVAYGVQKKSSITGAISSVDTKSIEMRPMSSATSALEGSTSGVQVNSTYGAPGSDPSIRIRGIGTVNGSSSPLYVIDGIPFGGNISDINPSDIQSISVLKDAASCALYGNRASNGVILIQTRQGKSEKMSFDLKINQGIYERGIAEYKLADADGFMEASWMSLRNSRLTAGDDAATAAAYATENLISERLYLNIYNKADNALFDANGKLVSDAEILPGYAEDLDWYDAGLRKGYRQEYNLSGNMATDKSSYYFSVGYLNENGYVTNADFSRFSARTSLSFTPKKWLKTGLTLSGTHQITNSTNGDSDGGYTNLFMYARNVAPIYPVHLHYPDGSYQLDDNGNKQYDGGTYTDANGTPVQTRNQYVDRHVIWENELNMDRTYRNTLQGIAFVDIKFLKDFTFSLKGDLNVRNSENQGYNNATIGDGKGNSGRASRTIYRYKNYTFQQQLRWNRIFNHMHSFDALVGHENYSNNYSYLYGYKTTETFAGKTNLSNFNNITNLTGYDMDYRTESYLGRVQYSYNNRINVEASFRRDGSSRFHKDNRWGNFGSVGANWVISREAFMSSLTWIDNLKLRANYGQVGNDAGTGYYGYMGLYANSQNANLGAYYLSQNAAYDLKWETGEAYGIGIEASLFNRWNLEVEYFNKRNKDLIFDVYLPLSAGATSTSSAEATITKNLGTIQNQGIEINTDVDIYRSRNWTVNFSTNATILRNKVVKLPEQNKDGIISGSYKIEEGRSRYEYYLYTFEGVDQMTGQSLYKINLDDYYVTQADGTILGNAEKTDITDKATLINGTYYVNNTTYAKKEYHGSPLPKIYGGFTGMARYKGLTVSAMFTYALGGKVNDTVYRSLMTSGTAASSVHEDVLNSWNGVPEGMTETSPDRILKDGLPEFNSSTSSLNNAGTTSRWLVSGDYLVFKNLTVSYQLPKKFVKRLDLAGVSFNLNCENLVTFTARQGLNPQQSFNGTQYNYLVTPRVYSLGININL